MATTYTYGPLKSQYFTQFEKLWMEGFCRENKIILDERNVATVLAKMLDSKKPSKDLGNKIQKLLIEAAGFSDFVKTQFNASWNKMLGYSMRKITAGGEALMESQVPAMKKDSMWWLKEAPKLMASRISKAYFNGIVLECVSGDHEILTKLKTIVKDGHSMLEKIQKSEPFTDKIGHMTMQQFISSLRERYPVNEVLANEPVFRLFPQPWKIINAAAWVAENVVRLEHASKSR